VSHAVQRSPGRVVWAATAKVEAHGPDHPEGGRVGEGQNGGLKFKQPREAKLHSTPPSSLEAVRCSLLTVRGALLRSYSISIDPYTAMPAGHVVHSTVEGGRSQRGEV
jgi:hypothetical protein